MLLLAAGEADVDFDSASRIVHIERHQGITGALDFADQMLDLLAMEQQFARAHGVGMDMGGGRGQGADMAADHVDLGATDEHIGVL